MAESGTSTSLVLTLESGFAGEASLRSEGEGANSVAEEGGGRDAARSVVREGIEVCSGRCKGLVSMAASVGVTAKSFGH